MYSPREDTFLINKALHFYDSEFGLKDKKVLELGWGIVITLSSVLKKGLMCLL